MKPRSHYVVDMLELRWCGQTLRSPDILISGSIKFYQAE